MKKQYHSIFNDVIGPIMAGPSSSHSAGCARIGLTVRNLYGRDIKKAVVVFDSEGSYPSTCVGQGSLFGFTGGLLGMETSDPRIKDSVEIAREQGVDISFAEESLSHTHPNEARIDVYGEDGTIELSVLSLSTGGGTFKIIDVNGESVLIDGGQNVKLYQNTCGQSVILNQPPDGKQLLRESGVVLPVELSGGEPVFTCAEEALDYAKCNNLNLSELALAYETSIGKVSESEVQAMTKKTLDVMKNAIIPPDPKTTKQFGFKPYTCKDMMHASDSVKTADAGCIDRAMKYALATMENSCAHNIVVAAPTAGSSGVIPGVIIGVGESLGKSEKEMCEALLACGTVGAVIAYNATFAAETAGCQAENGSASAMAAAGLVHMLGGSPEQGFRAAALALQNMLGIVCDPIGGLTDIPCTSRNVSAAANAVTSANMVMLGFDPMIPFDEVVAAMLEIGEALPASLKCTCCGGLCNTPTAKKIVEKK